MRKKTLYFCLSLLALASLFGSCQKEDLEGRIRISTEKIQAPSKVAIDGASTEWVTGDLIRINNSTKTVTVDGSTATIGSDGLSEPYYAVYPASLAASADLTTGSVDVEIPDEYTYSETGDGRQKLDLPMAAYASTLGSNNLKFKHLTAALMVRVTNSFVGTMYLHEIKIESDLSQISGSRTIDLSSTSAIESQSANDVSVTDKQKQVRMVFPTPLEIATGHKDIMIPVCPVSSSNKFTVTVVASNGTFCYTFSRVQQGEGVNTDRSLTRNQMGYVPVEMSSSGTYISSSTLVSNLSEYASMVSSINAASSGATLNYTISGTIDFANDYADSIVLKNGVTLNINGVNNAKLRNLKFRGNPCGWITSTGSSTNISLSDITIENVDLSEANDASQLRAGAFCSITYGTTGINNCAVRNMTLPSCTTKSTNKHIGGIVGLSAGTCTISGCSFEHSSGITLSPSANTFSFGCIIGVASNNSTSNTTITNCNVKVDNLTITPNASTNIGGIVGYANFSTSVTNSTVQNFDGDGNMAITVNSTKDNSGEYTGGICGEAYNDHLQTYSDNICRIALTEYKTHNYTTHTGVLFGHIQNGTSVSSNKLAGTGNTVTGSSLTLTGTGSNTNYGTSYLYLVGSISTANNGLPTGFSIGTPTFTNR